jgi:hypothetical protein
MIEIITCKRILRNKLRKITLTGKGWFKIIKEKLLRNPEKFKI